MSLVIDANAAAPPSAAALEPWTDATGHECGYYAPDGECHRIRLYGIGSFAFTRDSGPVRGAPEPGVAPEAFDDLFRRVIVPFVLHQQGWEVLHASGLVVAGVAVALCGESGTGKSTLAHAWRQRGGPVFADDKVPFSVESGIVSIQPIPFRIRLRPESARYFGSANGNGRDLAETRRPAPEISSSVLGAAYVLDHRHDEREGVARVDELRPALALPALLRQACWLSPRDRARNHRMIESYIAFANAVPIFRLSYPTGFVHLDETLDRLAAHVARWVGGQASASMPLSRAWPRETAR